MLLTNCVLLKVKISTIYLNDLNEEVENPYRNNRVAYNCVQDVL